MNPPTHYSARHLLKSGALSLAVFMLQWHLADARKFRWDPSQATPGPTLSLVAVSPDSSASPPVPRYMLVADGFPHGEEFELWTHRLPDETNQFVNGLKFSIDETGKMATKNEKKPFPRGVPLEKIRIGAWEFIPGEPLEFALASTSGETVAYARVIPYPIEHRKGNKRIWVELTPEVGKLYWIGGEGFAAREQLTAHSTSNGEFLIDTLTADSEGSIGILFGPRTAAEKSGHVRYSVLSGADTLAVAFDWGMPHTRK